MNSARLVTHYRSLAFTTLVTLALASCDDNPAAPRKLDAISVILPDSSIAVGQTVSALAATLDQDGQPIDGSAILWASSEPGVATVDGDGVVTGLGGGSAQIIATAGNRAGQVTITVVPPAAIRINEIESSGGTPGDWVELYNPTATPADLSGWQFQDDNPAHKYTIPAGTMIEANGYLVLEEADFDFGLGGADEARLSNPYDALVDSHGWTSHAPTTYGRCPDGTGDFAPTSAPTKGAANQCGTGGSAVAVWPGSSSVQTADGVSVFQGNLSGLTYEAATDSNPGILWAVRNGPGTLYRLIFSGGIWTPDPADDWGAGRALRYTDGTGNPDAEGVTYAGGGSAGGIYVATERNNDASGTSRNSILRFDPAASGSTIVATHDWNITADLPAVGPNLGIEAITWIPDEDLVAMGFHDEAAGKPYAPADYPNHGEGLFFVGVEGNGMIYVFALDHVASTAKRIASFTSGNPGVMGLEYDRDNRYLWSYCDDTCSNRAQILDVDVTPGSPSQGRFTPSVEYAAPAALHSLNNEGFAFAPESECIGNQRPVFWADDNETGGHSIRTGSLRCGRVTSSLGSGRMVR